MTSVTKTQSYAKRIAGDFAHRLRSGKFFFVFAVFGSLLLPAISTYASYNILFIAVDDLRPEMNCYGLPHMVTPNMDRLANSGRLFKHHYVSVATCGGSRYALFTGKRPTTLADTGNDAFNQLPTSEGSNPETFAHLFRRNGWHTVCLGKITDEGDSYRWNSSSALGGDDRGRTSVAKVEAPFSWDEIISGPDKWGARINPLFNYANGTGRVAGGSGSPAYEIGTNVTDEGYLDGHTAKAAIAKLQEFKQEGTRFLMAVGFYRPHLPFNAPKAYFDLYNPNTLPGPFPATTPIGALSGTASQSGELNNYNHGYYPGDPGVHTDDAYRRRLRWAYDACVSYVDAQVGKLLDTLDALNLATNTIVVLWGDHGWCLDDYNLLGKHIVLERGVHAPLIIRVPGMSFPGRAADGIVETIDIYPTLAKLCGLTPPATINGTSLIPMLNNPDAPGKGWAYSRDINSLTQDSIRTERWRLVRVNSSYDLYDFEASPYEVEDVSALHPDVVNDLTANKLNVQSTRSETASFNSWKSNFFNATERADASISGPHADPDGDNAPNLFEFLSTTNPKSASDAPQFIAGIQNLSAFGLPAEFFTARLRVSSVVDDVRFVLDGSTTLDDWGASAVSFVTNKPLGGGNYEYLFRLTNSVVSQTRGFLRLQLQQTP